MIDRLLVRSHAFCQNEWASVCMESVRLVGVKVKTLWRVHGWVCECFERGRGLKGKIQDMDRFSFSPPLSVKDE